MAIPNALHEGYRRFRDKRYRDEAALYRRLAKQQTPHSLIIGCADSRVDPATIFAASPGELFVVRNIAALVPPYQADSGYHGTSAAIEFAATSLKVENIVVLGHGLCGGIAASLAAGENQPVGDFVGPWVDMLRPTRDALLVQAKKAGPDGGQNLQKALEHRAIEHSLGALLTFPFIAQAVDAQTLSLHGAWFSIAEGRLEWLDTADGTFAEIAER